MLQGIGSAGAAPVVMPFIGDLFKGDDERITAGLGDIETSNTAGKVLSPILGSLLAAWFWFMPFWFIPFFAHQFFLVLFLVAKPEKQKEAPSISEFVKNVGRIFKRDGRWLFTVFIIGCVIMFLLFGVLFIYQTHWRRNTELTVWLKERFWQSRFYFYPSVHIYQAEKSGKTKAK